MARRAFYSFHYKADCDRASQVRNMGVVEGNRPAHDNEWESIKQGGDAAIQRWIDGQLDGRSCTIVLVGAATAGRKWINYEIKTSWNTSKGLVGIHVHNLKNLAGHQTQKGMNPFAPFTMKHGTGVVSLTNVVKTYDPPFWDSKMVYKYVCDNLSSWVEEALRIREQYSGSVIVTP